MKTLADVKIGQDGPKYVVELGERSAAEIMIGVCLAAENQNQRIKQSLAKTVIGATLVGTIDGLTDIITNSYQYLAIVSLYNQLCDQWYPQYNDRKLTTDSTRDIIAVMKGLLFTMNKERATSDLIPVLKEIYLHYKDSYGVDFPDVEPDLNWRKKLDRL